MEPEAAHGAAAAHESAGFPPFSQIDTFPSQIFWLVVTFVILYVAVAFVFLPRIRQAVEARDGVIKKDVAEAAALSGKADASVKEFEAKIAEARARARDEAARAKAAADKETAAKTAAVDADLNAKLSAAEARISEMRTKAMANVSAVAEDAAAAITERLTGAKPAPAAVKKAVADAVRG